MRRKVKFSIKIPSIICVAEERSLTQPMAGLEDGCSYKNRQLGRETSVYLGDRVTPGVATVRTGRPNKGALAAYNNTRTFNRIRVQQNAVYPPAFTVPEANGSIPE
jgi:hypothetical protein